MKFFTEWLFLQGIQYILDSGRSELAGLLIIMEPRMVSCIMHGPRML